jgi:hypothetical protein
LSKNDRGGGQVRHRLAGNGGGCRPYLRRRESGSEIRHRVAHVHQEQALHKVNIKATSGMVGKNPGLKKKPARWFFCFFGGFFGFFGGFLVKKKYICPEERVFSLFSVSRILLGASRL